MVKPKLHEGQAGFAARQRVMVSKRKTQGMVAVEQDKRTTGQSLPRGSAVIGHSCVGSYSLSGFNTTHFVTAW